MNLDNLTIGEAKQLASLFGQSQQINNLNCMIGKEVIIRTYSAGVWFGTLTEKAKNEVIISNARRLWKWKTTQSISLSAVSLYGINQDASRIAPAVDSVWLEAIEIIPCTEIAGKSIKESKDALAQ